MTVSYLVSGTPTGPDSIERLRASTRESSLISQRLARTRTRMWSVVMGQNLGTVAFQLEFDDATSALAYQSAWNADPEAQDLFRRTMIVDPVLAIDRISLYQEIDIGGASPSTTPSAALTAVMSVRPHMMAEAIAGIAKGLPVAKDLGATSTRLSALAIGAEVPTLVSMTEFEDLRGVGRLVDAYNDPANAAAQVVRGLLESVDGPVLGYATAVIEEISY